jgi:lambda family phage tail tape measure protein
LIRGAGQSISNAMTDIAFSGKGMNEILDDMVQSLAKVAYQVMVVEPLIQSLKASMAAAGLTSYAQQPTYGPPVTAMPNANGNAFSGGNVIPFAKGGVVSSPMLFPMSGGQTGLMGEAGPEAIMPLKRGKDGKLGVASGGSSTQVNIYNSNGGQVQTSERQDPNGNKVIDIYIKKAVAEAFARGEFDKTMGSTYGLRRQGAR